MGVSTDRNLQHAPGLSRLALRQRLQPLRPHLASQRPGRRRLPPSGKKTSSSTRSATRPGRWCRWGAMATVREINGPVLIQRYNMYPSAPINGEPAPGVSSGEAISLMADRRQPGPPPRHEDRMDRTGARCRSRPATRRCGCSCWRWCWCSSSWPRSTKAGRCRWP